MRYRIFFAALICIAAGAAHAEWKLYGDNGKAEFYYDEKSVIVSGGQVTVWEMLNYGFPLNGVLSNRSHKEYDCHSEKFRNLSGEFYSENMLKGNRVSNNVDPEDTWRPVIEGTQNQALMRLVCGMRS
ncbi:MAG: hypothetical protein RLZZ20_840 [Pseudomonadota bacterium]|jgi:hypothetical protein